LLLETAQKMNALAIGVKRVLENNAAIVRRYKVGATLTIGEYILPNILGAHKQAYPSIDISMIVQNTDAILERIDSGDLDFGLVEGPFNQNKYEHCLLQKDELILVFAPQHRLAGKNAVALQDLLDEKIIVREEGPGRGLSLKKSCRSLDIPWVISIQLWRSAT
jgi:DNA-binding transcriptional LysR family regulator